MRQAQAGLKAEKVILDTDIGPDCDDAGALAVLHSLKSKGLADILAIMHCTTNPWGAACIDAINTYFTDEDIPVGTLKGKGFLDDDENYYRYNKYIGENYPNRYASIQPEDAVGLYKKTLFAQEDKSVTVIAIGPQRNLSDLLDSPGDDITKMTGLELVERKVSNLYIMGGCFADKMMCENGYVDAEWNISMDVAAAKKVSQNWPTPIIYCGFEIGARIISGKLLAKTDKKNPVRIAYELHSPKGLRYSWDPLTIMAAIIEDKRLFKLSAPGKISVEDNGATIYTQDEGNLHSYVIAGDDQKLLENMLEEYLAYEPVIPLSR